MTWGLLIAAGLLLWIGAYLLIDEWMRRPRRKTLLERLEPFHRPWVADEAEEWLRRQ